MAKLARHEEAVLAEVTVAVTAVERVETREVAVVLDGKTADPREHICPSKH